MGNVTHLHQIHPKKKKRDKGDGGCSIKITRKAQLAREFAVRFKFLEQPHFFPTVKRTRWLPSIFPQTEDIILHLSASGAKWIRKTFSPIAVIVLPLLATISLMILPINFWLLTFLMSSGFECSIMHSSLQLRLQFVVAVTPSLQLVLPLWNFGFFWSVSEKLMDEVSFLGAWDVYM